MESSGPTQKTLLLLFPPLQVLSGSSGVGSHPSVAQRVLNLSLQEPGEDVEAPNMAAVPTETSEGVAGKVETGEEGVAEDSTLISAEAMHRQRCKHRCEHHFSPQTYPDNRTWPCRCESENIGRVIRMLRGLFFAPIELQIFFECAIEGLPVNSLGFKTIHREIPERWESPNV